ncbi:MAG: hypothetical protein AB7O24_23530 [Kofleriaceae bacterium]
MGRAPRAGKTSKLFSIRVTDAELASYEDAATAANMSVSEWMREACARAISNPIQRKIIGTDVEDELLDKAIASFVRAGGAQPAHGSSTVEKVGDEHHVVLRNVSGELARYRVTEAEKLVKVEAPRRRKA